MVLMRAHGQQAVDLLFTLRPDALHRAFPWLKVAAHRREILEDGLDALPPELRACEVGEEDLHFTLPAMLRLPMAFASMRLERSAIASPTTRAPLVTHTPSINANVATSFGMATLTIAASSAFRASASNCLRSRSTMGAEVAYINLISQLKFGQTTTCSVTTRTSSPGRDLDLTCRRLYTGAYDGDRRLLRPTSRQ